MIGKLRVGKLYVAYRSLNETSISTELFSDAISISPFRRDNVQLSEILLNICWICFSFWVSCSCCDSFDSSARRHASLWRRAAQSPVLQSWCNHAEWSRSQLSHWLHTLSTQWALQRDELFCYKCVMHTSFLTNKTNSLQSQPHSQTAVIGVSAIPALLLDTNTECFTYSSIHSIANLLSGKAFLPAM